MLSRAVRRSTAHHTDQNTAHFGATATTITLMPARIGPSQTEFLGDEYEVINVSWKWHVLQVPPPGTPLLCTLRFVLVWDTTPTQLDSLFQTPADPANSFFADDSSERYIVLQDIRIPLNAFTNTIDFTTYWPTGRFSGSYNFDVAGRVSKAETRTPPLTSLPNHGVYKVFTGHSPFYTDLVVSLGFRTKFLIKPLL